MHTVSMYGTVDTFEILIPKMGNFYLRKTDINGYTPLHYAIIFNNYKIAKLLFNHKSAITFYIKP
jgi:ankyrin repeat protein